MLKRRDALLGALFGSGYIGLRALATGLPAWFLANPSKANAQELACAINAKENLQYLIVSSSSPTFTVRWTSRFTGESMSASLLALGVVPHAFAFSSDVNSIEYYPKLGEGSREERARG